MNAARVQQLAWFKSPSERGPGYLNDLNLNVAEIPWLEETEHYLECYKNLRFGWDLVSELVRDGKDFPTIIDAEDNCLWRAYLYLQGYYDPHIDGALRLTLSGSKRSREMLNGLFAHKGITLQDIAKNTNTPIGVVIAYEKLFYNIVDRRTDTKFLAEVVYPDTRLVELFESYMRDESFGNMLQRMSFNNSPEELLYFMGMADNPYDLLHGHESANRLEALIMSQGYLYARSGFANQRQNAQVLHRSQQLLTAAKQAGNDTEEQSAFQAVGNALYNEFATVKRAEAELRIMRTRETSAARVIDADVIESD
jgi:hypothetical protein